MGWEPLKYNTRALLQARVCKKNDAGLNECTDCPLSNMLNNHVIARNRHFAEDWHSECADG